MLAGMKSVLGSKFRSPIRQEGKDDVIQVHGGSIRGEDGVILPGAFPSASLIFSSFKNSKGESPSSLYACCLP